MGISVRGLIFERDGRRVIDIPSLELAAGSVTAVFGANGAGKTTLLRILAGLAAPLRGEVALGAAHSARERSRASALAFQEPVFLRGTVRRNLLLGLALRGVPPGDRTLRIERAAEETGVTGLLERSARALSVGEAQRVSLARALALEAPVLLLDEPLAGVDHRTRRTLLHDLPRLLHGRKATTLIVTHDREEAFRLADRLAVMVDGRVVRHGSAEQLYGAPGTMAVAELLGFTVLDADGELVAVPPNGFRIGPGEGVDFEFEVADIVTMGDHRHLVGCIAGVPVEFPLVADDVAPVPGTRIRVRATGIRRVTEVSTED